MRGRVIARVDSSILQFEDVISDTIRAIRINYVPAQGIFNNSVNLDNQSFSKVIEATIDTSNKKQAGIYKVYVAKQQGLVAYVEYPSLKLWVKQ